MSEIRFEWDEKKHALNKRKHGVSFNEGQTVFADENGLLLDDPDHSHDEDRFILLGMSTSSRILVVICCERHHGNKIRIISARKATKKEGIKYEKGI